ncbi:hypothetical protein BH10ACT11_BH10ACT11_06420 [soil metagenome]
MALSDNLPPLLADRPRNLQILFAVVAPAVFGIVAGLLLGSSKGAYIVVSLIAAIGGVGAGFDHSGWIAGAKRGLLGGTLYGAFILIAHEISGSAARVDLPDPAIVLVVVTAMLGALFGALGGFGRQRVAGPS